MSKVSIIIPIYNGEKYLEECIQSVLHQSLSDIEVICVDDGSTDGSLRLLQEYQKRDDRIKVFHQENQGVTVARGVGLKLADGEYVGFMDCDDWLEPNMFEDLYEYATKNQVNFVSSGYIMEGAYSTMHFDCIPEGIYAGDGLLELRNNAIYNLAEQEIGFRGSLCNKLFERNFISEVFFSIPSVLAIGEDKMCVLKCALEAKRVGVLHKSYYHYRQHANSVVHSSKADYLLCVNDIYTYLKSVYSHENFTETMRLQAEIYVTELLFKGINTRMGFHHRNLLWIDPDWLKELPHDARVVLYGGGELGEKYRAHMAGRKDLIYVGTVDYTKEMPETEKNITIFPIKALDKWKYDYIVITIKNPTKANEIKYKLIETGIPQSKIIWYEQKELFWKYVKADGLLDI